MAKNSGKTITRVFILITLAVILYLLFLIFQHFIPEIVIAAILATILHPWYKKLLKILKGHKNITAFIMSFFILLVIIIPLANIGYFFSQRAVQAYQESKQIFNNLPNIINLELLYSFNIDPQYISIIQDVSLDIVAYLRNIMVDWGSSFIRETSQALSSLLLIILTSFFVFRDSDSIIKYIKELIPLPKKYDKLIWQKFKDVSNSVIISEFGAALAQSVLAVIGLLIAGLPVFILALLIFLTALIPYLGTIIIWVPLIIYLFLSGQIWQAVFLIIWSIIVVGLSDNIIRPYLIKGKIEVHPLIVFFSIIGAIIVFGFWGVFIGPLIVAMAVVVFDIYKLEFISKTK